ncbi:hypothetical protein ACIGW8_07195 [Streptomyces sioyaensis]|uniref:hypothetical protein n=1 Tax=Streptomyces sioyaensis TaxID=67364 RepID=UPI0037D50A8F
MSAAVNSNPAERPVPDVGDEVEYAPGLVAIVTDIRKGVPYLRGFGRREWPAPAPDDLRVTRKREQLIADGDLW